MMNIKNKEYDLVIPKTIMDGIAKKAYKEFSYNRLWTQYC